MIVDISDPLGNWHRIERTPDGEYHGWENLCMGVAREHRFNVLQHVLRWIAKAGRTHGLCIEVGSGVGYTFYVMDHTPPGSGFPAMFVGEGRALKGITQHVPA